MKRVFFCILSVLFLCGCAAMKTVAVKEGMSKNDVKAVWGEPRIVKNHKNSCCRDKSEETWYYYNTAMQKRKPSQTVVFSNDSVSHVFIGL